MRRNRPPSQRKRDLDASGKVQKATAMIVALGRHLGWDDAKIRADVGAAFRVAIGGEGIEVITVETSTGPEKAIPTSGLLRLVLRAPEVNWDLTDPHVQERAWSIVQQAMERALALPSFEGPFQPFEGWGR